MTRFSKFTRTLLIAAGLGLAVVSNVRGEAVNPFTPAQRQQLEQDLQNARTLLENQRDALIRWTPQAQQAFEAAFGTTDPAARVELLTQIDRQLQAAQRLTADSFRLIPATDPNADAFAYVYPNDPNTIYLGSRYWHENTPAVGTDSRAGTLIHEISHFVSVAGTRDVTYGTHNAGALALDYRTAQSPEFIGPVLRPWTNADNVEYYMEGALGQQPNTTSPVSPVTPEAGSSPLSAVDPAQSARLGFNENARRPSAPANPQPGLTQEQFQAELQRTMAGFQQSVARKPEQATRTAPSDLPAEVAVPSTGSPVAATTPVTSRVSGTNNFTPGFFENRTAANAPPSDYQPRENRAWSIDGSSRLVGRGRNSAMQRFQGFQQQAANQIAQQQQGRQNRAWSIDGSSRPIGSGQSFNVGTAEAPQQRPVQPSQTPSTSNNVVTGASQEARAPQSGVFWRDPATGQDLTPNRPSRIAFDDNAPRNQPPSASPARPQPSVDAPAVRQVGEQRGTRSANSATASPATANPQPAVAPTRTTAAPTVAPRQSGSRSQTAAMISL